jgi:hypothetical protein
VVVSATATALVTRGKTNFCTMPKTVIVHTTARVATRHQPSRTTAAIGV